VAALDRKTGKVIWTAPGEAAAYAGFIKGSFGGRSQVIGYDTESLGSWDIETGERIWTLMPKEEGEFNVPTPVIVEDKLLLSMEKNGTRLYGFDAAGKIIPNPLAINEDLVPDIASPVVIDGLVFGVSGRLFCLDIKQGLKTVWVSEDDHYFDNCTFIAGNGRVLITGQDGYINLLEVNRKEYRCISSVKLFPEASLEERAVWSHPALTGNRFYVMNATHVYCYQLD
jgi:outer membrane protein assembly factor BamB